jgi:hypothetical protein
LPIWIPGSGSVETWDLVNAHDYCYGYLSFSGKAAAEPIVNGFWEHAAANNASLNPNRMAFTQIICCADSDAEAEALYGDSVRYFYRNNPIPLEFVNDRAVDSGRPRTSPELVNGTEDQGESGRAELLGVRRAGLHHRRHPRARLSTGA